MQKISDNFPRNFVHNYHMNVFGESNSWSTEGAHCCDVMVLILKQRLGQVKGSLRNVCNRFTDRDDLTRVGRWISQNNHVGLSSHCLSNKIVAT